MPLPEIDITAIPMLDTAVGLFGSFAGETAGGDPGTFEATVSIMLIIYD